MVVDKEYNIVKPTEYAIADLESYSLNPTFHLKVKLRDTYIPPTSIILITIETLDPFTKEKLTVGYSAIHLFITNDSKH